jgi:hypothetical protein
MFELRPEPELSVPDQDDRRRKLQVWSNQYPIEIVEYVSVTAVMVKIGDAMFVDNAKDFPSELLFANISLAIETGNLKPHEGVTFEAIMVKGRAWTKAGKPKKRWGG